MKNYDKKTIDEIRAKAYAHGCQKEGVFIALNWLKREEITAQEKQEAMETLEAMRKENAESYQRGEFRLCPMWMDKEGDFNNHRARAELIAKNGDRYLIELTTWTPRGEKLEQLHCDFSVNLTEEEHHKKKLMELREKNGDKPRNARSQADLNERNHRMQQPYYWHESEKAREFLKWKPATRETALNLINYLYWTNFQSLEINELIMPEWVNKD